MLVVGQDTLKRVEQLQTSMLAMKAIANPEGAEAVSLSLNEAAGLADLIEARRKEIKAPVLELAARIDEVARGPKDRLASVIQTARALLRSWDYEMQRRREKAERDRQAEIARIEAERAKIEKEKADAAAAAERQRQEAARLQAEQEALLNRAPDMLDDLDEPPPPPDEGFPGFAPVQPAPADDLSDLAEASTAQREAELTRQEAALSTPAVVVPAAPAGITYKTLLKHEVTNLDLLPRQFQIRTANDAAIRATFCNKFNPNQALPTCPGVRFYVEREPVRSARR